MNSARLLAGCLSLLACLVAWPQSPATPSPVTDTRRVSTGGNKTELLRKINGRWWSEDNREVYPPSTTGFFWEYDSKPGVVNFYHHRPFRLEYSESLHLFMQRADVEALLGQPNRIFGMGPDSAFWHYYSANGTKLSIRFMDGGVGEANYEHLKGKNVPVASVQSDLGGRNIYAVLAERATQRVQQSRPQAAASSYRGANSSQARMQYEPSVAIPETTTRQQPERKRIASAEVLATILPGITLEDLIARLGEPSSRSAITGSSGTLAILTYHRQSGDPVEIRLLNGKVVQAPR